MMWIGLLARFWPYLAGAALVIGAGLYLHHQGYESGHAASEAHWQPLFAAAERARDEANARAQKTEADSRAISDQSEKRHAETIASLNLRADAAERSNRDLVRKLSARARGGALPQTGGPAAIADAAPASDPVADRAASDLTDLARRCESDAAQLSELQDWTRSQLAILR